jgi:hypothetical protein
MGLFVYVIWHRLWPSVLYLNSSCRPMHLLWEYCRLAGCAWQMKQLLSIMPVLIGKNAIRRFDSVLIVFEPRALESFLDIQPEVQRLCLSR